MTFSKEDDPAESTPYIRYKDLTYSIESKLRKRSCDIASTSVKLENQSCYISKSPMNKRRKRFRY